MELRKNTAFFSSLLQHKVQIKCYFKIQTTFALFSLETKSDNENREKTIFLMIVDCSVLTVFHSALTLSSHQLYYLWVF